MKTGSMRLALTALALTTMTTGTARAGDSEDFAACDGLKKPKRSDDGMRGVATITGYNQFSSIFGPPQRKSAAKVAACTLALEHDKLLPSQTLRRAHLLRARAAALIDQGKYGEALADLDRAGDLVGPMRSDPFFARSMGVSLDMMRALAHAGLGDKASAAQLAEAAALQRPYAMQVQTAAHALRQAAGTSGAVDSGSHHLLRLEPKAKFEVLLAEYKAGNFAAVRDLARSGAITLGPAQGDTAEDRFAGLKIDNAFLGALAATLAAAYADAALGDEAGARARIALVRDRLGMADERAEGAEAPKAATALVADQVARPLIALTEARLLLASEGPETAFKSLQGIRLPVSAATTDLFDAMREQAAGVEGLTIPPIAPPTPSPDRPERVDARLGDLADMLLIAPESERKLIDYKKSRPNILGALIGGALSMGTSLLGGIDRLSGFRSAEQEDGTLKVEYVGNTTSGPVVQEMTLLRAAELAQEAGKPRFAIVERRDYQRYMAMTQYGIERSRTLSGYKTELTIRLLDEGEAAPAAFDAVAVIDDLGPLYYGEA